MLLPFFRINDPYRLLGLLIALLLLSLPLLIDTPAITLHELKSFVLGEEIIEGKLMYVEIFDSTAPLTSGIFGAVQWVFGRSLMARHVLAMLVIFFQASFFAILLIQNKAYYDNTYVPGLVFGILCFFSFDLLTLSPELLASTILLFALNNLFKEIEFRVDRDETMLNLGVYLGVATLLVFSYIVFLLGTVFLLFVFTRLNIRKLAMLFYGFALPHVLLGVLYFMWGELGSLWENYYLPNLTISGTMLIGVKGILTLVALPFTYFVFSLFMLNREARFTKYQWQLFQVMFTWMLLCVLQVIVTREFSPHSFIIFIPSLAYFISHYLLLIRRKWIAEAMLWIFLGGILTLNIMSRYGYISNVDFSKLFPSPSSHLAQVRNERVMMLIEDDGIYLYNKMGGYFLNWQLSRKILERPGYYENVILVEKALATDTPDRIIDPDDMMRDYFVKLPEWRRQYVRESDSYKRISKSLDNKSPVSSN